MSDSETMKRFALGMPPAAAVPSALSAKQASPFALQPEVITRMVYEAMNEEA